MVLRVIYVGSTESVEYDQILEEVRISPLKSF